MKTSSEVAHVCSTLFHHASLRSVFFVCRIQVNHQSHACACDGVQVSSMSGRLLHALGGNLQGLLHGRAPDRTRQYCLSAAPFLPAPLSLGTDTLQPLPVHSLAAPRAIRPSALPLLSSAHLPWHHSYFPAPQRLHTILSPLFS